MLHITAPIIVTEGKVADIGTETLELSHTQGRQGCESIYCLQDYLPPTTPSPTTTPDAYIFYN